MAVTRQSLAVDNQFNLLTTINKLKSTKKADRCAIYETLTSVIIKGGFGSHVIDVVNTTAIPITLSDIIKGNEKNSLTALEFLGSLLQIIKLNQEKQIEVIKVLSNKLKTANTKFLTRKLMWCLANIQFDQKLPESSLNLMLESAFLFLGENPPILSLSTVCESLNTLKSIGHRNFQFLENNLPKTLQLGFPWMFHEADRIRELALDSFKPFATSIEKGKLMGDTQKIQLKTKFHEVLMRLVAAESLDGLKIWSFLIAVFGRELHDSVSLLNDLLKVEESALKSQNVEFRQAALEHWRHIIDCFALNPLILNNSKRLKLVLVPLKSIDIKSEKFCISKVHIWWHLLDKLEHNAVERFEEVTAPLLHFCYGEPPSVKGMISNFPSTAQLITTVLSGVLSREQQFKCGKLSRSHVFLSDENFEKFASTLKKYSIISISALGSQSKTLVSSIVHSFTSRCQSIELQSYVNGLFQVAVQKKMFFETILSTLSNNLEGNPQLLEAIVNNIFILLQFSAENKAKESLNNFLDSTFQCAMSQSVSFSTLMAQTLEQLKEEAATAVDLWSRYVDIYVNNPNAAQLADLTLLLTPLNWTKYINNEEFQKHWQEVFTILIKNDPQIFSQIFNQVHKEVAVRDLVYQMALNSFISDYEIFLHEINSWTKDWGNAWIQQAEMAETGPQVNDSIANLITFLFDRLPNNFSTAVWKNLKLNFQSQTLSEKVRDILKDVTNKLSDKYKVVKEFRELWASTQGLQMTPRTTKRRGRPSKNFDDFVVILPTPKANKRVLTEHQKEVMRSKRITSDLPAMYNDLSQNSLAVDMFSSDTQSNDIVNSIPASIVADEAAQMEPPKSSESLQADNIELLKQDKENVKDSTVDVEEILLQDSKLRSKLSVDIVKLDQRSCNPSTKATDISNSDSLVLETVSIPDLDKSPELSRKEEKVNDRKMNSSSQPVFDIEKTNKAPAFNSEPWDAAYRSNEIVAAETVSESVHDADFAGEKSPVPFETVPESDVECLPVSKEVHTEEAAETSQAANEMKEATQTDSISSYLHTSIAGGPEQQCSETGPQDVTASASDSVGDSSMLSEPAKSQPTTNTTDLNSLDMFGDNFPKDTRSKKVTLPIKAMVLSNISRGRKRTVKSSTSSPSTGQRGAQILELSRRLRSEAHINKSKQSDKAPLTSREEATPCVTITPEHSPGGKESWVPHIYSPHASPSAGILKKRPLGDDCDSTDSSPNNPVKSRRVSFADPEVSRSLDIPAASTRRSSRTRRSLMSTYKNAGSKMEPLNESKQSECNPVLDEKSSEKDADAAAAIACDVAVEADSDNDPIETQGSNIDSSENAAITENVPTDPDNRDSSQVYPDNSESRRVDEYQHTTEVTTLETDLLTEIVNGIETAAVENEKCVRQQLSAIEMNFTAAEEMEVDMSVSESLESTTLVTKDGTVNSCRDKEPEVAGASQDDTRITTAIETDQLNTGEVVEFRDQESVTVETVSMITECMHPVVEVLSSEGKSTFCEEMASSEPTIPLVIEQIEVVTREPTVTDKLQNGMNEVELSTAETVPLIVKEEATHFTAIVVETEVIDLVESSQQSEGDSSHVLDSQLGLDTNGPICPEFTDCSDPVSAIISQFVADSWIDGVLVLLKKRNIHTVGNLASLTESEMHQLPFKNPSRDNVRQILKSYIDASVSSKGNKATRKRCPTIETLENELPLLPYGPDVDEVLVDHGNLTSNNDMELTDINRSTESLTNGQDINMSNETAKEILPTNTSGVKVVVGAVVPLVFQEVNSSSTNSGSTVQSTTRNTDARPGDDTSSDFLKMSATEVLNFIDEHPEKDAILLGILSRYLTCNGKTLTFTN